MMWFLRQWKLRRLARKIRTSDDWSARILALEALADLGGPEATDLLLDVLRNDESRIVITRAANRLGEIGTPKAIDPLVAVLDEMWRGRGTKNAEVTEKKRDLGGEDLPRALIRALRKIGDRRVCPSLIPLLADWDLRAEAYIALQELEWTPTTPDERLLQALCARRYAEAAAMGAAAVEPLLEVAAFDREDDGSAMRALIQMRATAVAPLVASMQAGSAKAVEILGLIRDPQALEPLRAISQNPASGAGLRAAALAAVERIEVALTGRSPKTRALDPVGDARFQYLTFSPDGALLAGLTRPDFSLRDPQSPEAVVWDVRSGAMLRTHPAASWLAFSPDGALLAVAGSSIRLWDAHTGVSRGELPETARCLAFSPDSKHLVSVDGAGTITRWDIATQTETAALHNMQVTATPLAISADASTVVSHEGYGEVREARFLACDAATAEVTARMEGGSGSLHCAALSSDGRRFAYGTDWPFFTVFDTRSGEPLKTVASEYHAGMPDESTPVYGVAFSPDGTLLAGSDANGTFVWNVATGEQQDIERLTSGGFTAVAFSPDGKLLAIV